MHESVDARRFWTAVSAVRAEAGIRVEASAIRRNAIIAEPYRIGRRPHAEKAGGFFR